MAISSIQHRSLSRLIMILVVITIVGIRWSAPVIAQQLQPPLSEVILMTGFEPFGGLSVNSSWEAVRQFDGRELPGGQRIVTVQLPVVWETADDILQGAIDSFDPQLVIGVGQGGGTISLEQYAHNENGYIRDNERQLPPQELISEIGPAVYSTPFNLDRLHSLLDNAGIRNVISNSAGDYLCNFVSYNTYDYLASVYPGARALFVHVPPIYSLDDTSTLEQIVTALDIIVRDTSNQMLEMQLLSNTTSNEVLSLDGLAITLSSSGNP